MNDVTLRQLQYFVAVAETQSITKAADRSHVSQAAVSLAITDLERSLGVTLTIRRRAKGVALTAEGRAILTDARVMLDHATELAERASQARNELSGPLAIGCFRTLSMHVVPHLVQWFAENHPKVSLTVHEDNGRAVQERMQNGQLAACIIYEAQLLPNSQSLLIQEQRRQAILPANHDLCSQDEVSLRDLAQWPAVLLDEVPALERTLNEFHSRSLEPNILLRTRSVQTAQNVIGRGLAYGLLIHCPRQSPEGHLLTGRPIKDDLPRNALMMAVPPGRHTAKVRALHEALLALPDHSKT
ncbi:MAG TPA: LysR family transcriptional regulator [Candidatus Yaniella excrementavium]|nr:LysR family transcriptional regulator [Candidatus Yaniella excrementavium]